MEKIKREKVDELFVQRVKEQPDFNSVLDASVSPEAHKSNLLHDYYSKKYLFKFLKPKKTDIVLDFGCGVGRLSLFLSPHVKQIYGIDAVKEMILVARSNFSRANIEYLVLNEIENLPDSFFDKIFINWVLVHISDEELRTYSKWFFKLLKPGGQLFVFEQIEGCESYASEVYKRRKSSDYINELTDAGFLLVKQQKVYRFPSYSRAIWNRLNIKFSFLLPFLYRIELLTINRKPHTAAYYTEALVFQKPLK